MRVSIYFNLSRSHKIIFMRSYFHENYIHVILFSQNISCFSDTKVHPLVSAMHPHCPHTNPGQLCITPFCKQPIFPETDPIFRESDTVKADPIFRETDTVKTDREQFWKPSRFRFCVLYFLSILSKFLSAEKLTQNDKSQKLSNLNKTSIFEWQN